MFALDQARGDLMSCKLLSVWWVGVVVVVCAGANSSKAASLIKKAQMGGCSVEISACKSVSRLMNLLNFTSAFLENLSYTTSVLIVRGGLFIVSDVMTYSSTRLLSELAGVSSISIGCLSQGVSSGAGSLAPLAQFVVPSKSRATAVLGITAARAHEYSELLIGYGSACPRGPVVLRCVGHLDSCLFALSH